MFKIKPMHSLHPGLLKLYENGFVVYVSSRTLCIVDGGSVCSGRTFVSLEGVMLCKSGSLLASI